MWAAASLRDRFAGMSADAGYSYVITGPDNAHKFTIL
jgi:hypothetical protein